MEVIKLKKLIASVTMKDDNNNSDEPSITEGEESDLPSSSSPSLSSIPINSIIPDSSILDSMPSYYMILLYQILNLN
jgi:hypothetical protein